MKYSSKHPYLFILLLEIVIILILFTSGYIAISQNLPNIMVYIISLTLLTIFSGFLLLRNKEWLKFCFARFNKKNIYLIIIPTIPIFLSLDGSFNLLNIQYYLLFTFLTMMTGFAEETLFRGIILKVLMSKSLWIASIVSALLFALTHSMNALAGWNINTVIMQISYSFTIGFAWSAFAIKSKTVWPLMIIHFITNFLSFIKSENSLSVIQNGEVNAKSILIITIMSVLLIIYGILVIRSAKEEKITDKE